MEINLHPRNGCEEREKSPLVISHRFTFFAFPRLEEFFLPAMIEVRNASESERNINMFYEAPKCKPECVCEAEKAKSMWHSRWAKCRNVYGMVNEQKGGKFIVPSGAFGDGKYASQLSFLFLVCKACPSGRKKGERRRRKMMTTKKEKFQRK